MSNSGGYMVKNRLVGWHGVQYMQDDGPEFTGLLGMQDDGVTVVMAQNLVFSKVLGDEVGEGHSPGQNDDSSSPGWQVDTDHYQAQTVIWPGVRPYSASKIPVGLGGNYRVGIKCAILGQTADYFEHPADDFNFPSYAVIETPPFLSGFTIPPASDNRSDYVGGALYFHSYGSPAAVQATMHLMVNGVSVASVTSPSDIFYATVIQEPVNLRVPSVALQDGDIVYARVELTNTSFVGAFPNTLIGVIGETFAMRRLET